MNGCRARITQFRQTSTKSLLPKGSRVNQGISDGIFRTKLHYQEHEQRLYAEKTQINEGLILEGNTVKRTMEQRPMEWGRMVATIPEITYSQWLLQYPELRGNDRLAKQRTLLRLINENPQFKVVDKI